jgi:hypothetical protein
MPLSKIRCTTNGLFLEPHTLSAETRILLARVRLFVDRAHQAGRSRYQHFWFLSPHFVTQSKQLAKHSVTQEREISRRIDSEGIMRTSNSETVINLSQHNMLRNYAHPRSVTTEYRSSFSRCSEKRRKKVEVVEKLLQAVGGRFSMDMTSLFKRLVLRPAQ